MSELKRLNKYISDSGLCSRREADKLIEKGVVTVNGKKPEMGAKIGPLDKVLVNRKPLELKDNRTILIYNKPVGIECHATSKANNNVVKNIGYKEKLFPIDNLDKNSEGLVFVTNDKNYVMKAEKACKSNDKEYIVVVKNQLKDNFLDRITAPDLLINNDSNDYKVKVLNKNTCRIIIKAGQKNQARRMCEALGYEIDTISLVKALKIETKGLRPGDWRYLSLDEIKKVNNAIEALNK